MAGSEDGKLGYAKTGHILRQQALERSQKCREDYEANPKHCLFCGEEIPFEKRRSKFCDKSCSASYNNVGVTRNPSKKRFCSCGKPVVRQNKYCRECASKHVYQRPASIESARTDEARKKLLLEKRGHYCEGCELREWRGKPIPIELHHVDADTDNNKEENLQLLCPNCHAQSDTHRTRNKNGKRQQMRRKRYANGQTW